MENFPTPRESSNFVRRVNGATAMAIAATVAWSSLQGPSSAVSSNAVAAPVQTASAGGSATPPPKATDGRASTQVRASLLPAVHTAH